MYEPSGEINRLRDRLHAVESSVTGVKLLIDDLREWRAEMRAWQSKVEDDINALSKSEEIAAAVSSAVAEKLKEKGSITFTRVQLFFGGLGVAAAIASPIIILVRG